MPITSYEVFLCDYYGTDHHWNIHGVLKAYESIHKMLSRTHPILSPPIDHENILNFPDIEFFGSYARGSFFPIKADNFEVAKIDYPPYKILVDGIEIKNRSNEKYYQGKYSIQMYTDHYAQYNYNGQKRLVEYIFENGSDRNLLIIGNSFNYPLEPLLAYHYHHTYSINYRNFPRFSFSKFLSTHSIDDVLIVADNSIFSEDLGWDINP